MDSGGIGHIFKLKHEFTLYYTLHIKQLTIRVGCCTTDVLIDPNICCIVIRFLHRFLWIKTFETFYETLMILNTYINSFLHKNSHKLIDQTWDT